MNYQSYAKYLDETSKILSGYLAYGILNGEQYVKTMRKIINDLRPLQEDPVSTPECPPIDLVLNYIEI